MANLPNLFRGFSSGAIGGLANTVVIAVLGLAGVTAMLGIKMPPPEMPAFLYKQIIWGGLWGLLLVTPVLKDSWWQRGLLLGTMATAVHLFYFLPQNPNAGILGLNAGAMTPVLIISVTWIYGVVASWFYRSTS